jgi:hypothetical protein
VRRCRRRRRRNHDKQAAPGCFDLRAARHPHRRIRE